MKYIISALLFGASITANAAVYNLGTLTAQSTQNVFALFNAGIGDNYNFTVNEDFAFTSSVAAYDVIVPGFGISLSNSSGFLFGQDTLSPTTPINSFATAVGAEVTEKLLTAGDYTFSITGNSSDTTSAYIGSFTVGRAAVAAVPEPASYAMFLAGLGLLGFSARRRSA